MAREVECVANDREGTRTWWEKTKTAPVIDEGSEEACGQEGKDKDRKNPDGKGWHTGGGLYDWTLVQGRDYIPNSVAVVGKDIPLG